MFDVGFFELLIIGIIALLVVGPERLPKVARTAGAWVGRMRSFVGSVKRDIAQEIEAEELKKAFDTTDSEQPLHDIIEETRQVFTDIKKEAASVTEGLDSTQSDGDPKTSSTV